MSAYQLPDAHLGAIARWAIDHNRGAFVRVYWEGSSRQYDFDAIARILAAANYRSVRARYPSGPLPGPVDAEDGPVRCALRQSQYARLEAVDMLKALASYSYQACESDDFDTTEAYALMQHLKGAAIRALPGFDASPAWNIDYTATDQAAYEARARSEHHAAELSRAAFINSQY